MVFVAKGVVVIETVEFWVEIVAFVDGSAFSSITSFSSLFSSLFSLIFSSIFDSGMVSGRECKTIKKTGKTGKNRKINFF